MMRTRVGSSMLCDAYVRQYYTFHAFSDGAKNNQKRLEIAHIAHLTLFDNPSCEQQNGAFLLGFKLNCSHCSLNTHSSR